MVKISYIPHVSYFNACKFDVRYFTSHFLTAWHQTARVEMGISLNTYHYHNPNDPNFLIYKVGIPLRDSYLHPGLREAYTTLTKSFRNSGRNCPPSLQNNDHVGPIRMIILCEMKGWSFWMDWKDNHFGWTGRMIILDGLEGWSFWMDWKDDHFGGTGRMIILDGLEGWWRWM